VRIGLDLDGVCYNFERRARQVLEQHRGVSFPHGGSRDWNWIRDRVPSDDWAWMWKQISLLFEDESSWYPGAPSVMRQLCEENDVVVITSRPTRARGATKRALNHIGVVPAELHVLSYGVPKTTVPHCDVYVDDMPGNITGFLTWTTASVLVPRRHWNTDMEITGWEDRVRRYDNLKEVLEWARRAQ